jgi:hypothetical protein
MEIQEEEILPEDENPEDENDTEDGRSDGEEASDDEVNPIGEESQAEELVTTSSGRIVQPPSKLNFSSMSSTYSGLQQK